MTERKPTLGFSARETAPGRYQFQKVVYTVSRNGGDMTKTYNPHAELLSEGEVRLHGDDPNQLIRRAREQRISNPAYEWRHHVISYQDLW